MAEVGSEVKKPESFWTNTENYDLNPTLTAAKILAAKGVQITISDTAFSGRRGEYMPGYVAILAVRDSFSVLKQIEDTPEFKALNEAYVGLRQPNFDNCQWDEQTQIRVESFYWSRKAQGLRRFAKSKDEEKWGSIVSCEQEAKKLLDQDKLESITYRDMSSLLEPAVNRVLAQPTQTS